MLRLQHTILAIILAIVATSSIENQCSADIVVNLYDPGNSLDPTLGGNQFTASDINVGTDLDLDGNLDAGSGNAGAVSSNGVSLDRWQIDDTDDDNTLPTYYYDLTPGQVDMMALNGFTLTMETENFTGGWLSLGVNREFLDNIFGYTIFEADGMARFWRPVPSIENTSIWSWNPQTSAYTGPAGQNAPEDYAGMVNGGGRILFSSAGDTFDAARFNITSATLTIHSVPEPSSALVLVGVGLLVLSRKRSKSNGLVA